MTDTQHITIFTPDNDNSFELPLSDSKIAAGFPSPAEDNFYLKLDITKEIIKNPAATFYARVSGVSMIEDGINDGDLLVIDKSVEPYDNCLAVCYIDGEFTLKHFKRKKDHALLIPANKDYKTITVTEENNFVIWGVVRYVIKKV
ncbi:MAG: translesion error-prone DNA polymerase V autoproteolytic subunit [Bacteroidales bacterium]|jgi:DNA polymerase V|nr:translesion error-prone DNA polymerase V autoproteolytic subunit [Bacteroidales bacterium]